MEKNFLILLIICSLCCCQKREQNNLEVISSFYKKLGDSIVLVEYKNEFGFKFYNSKVQLPPIAMLNDFKGKMETHYEIFDDRLIVYSTAYLGKKNPLFDEKEKLIDRGILKTFNYKSKSGCNFNLDGLVFLFNSKNSSYIIVKENVFNMTYNEIEEKFYKKYGVVGKDSFVSLPKKYSDSATFITYKTLWRDNFIFSSD